jgi:hypothetical protein
MDEYYGSYPVGPNRKQVILRLTAGVALLLIVGAIIVWLIFFHHKSPDITSKVGEVKTSQQSKKTGNSSTGSTPSQTKTPSSGGTQSGATPSAPSSAGSSSNKAATGNTSTGTSRSNSTADSGNTPAANGSNTSHSADLSQTGPGSVIGLFALTVVLMAGLRRWQLSRR